MSAPRTDDVSAHIIIEKPLEIPEKIGIYLKQQLIAAEKATTEKTPTDFLAGVISTSALPLCLPDTPTTLLPLGIFISYGMPF